MTCQDCNGTGVIDAPGQRVRYYRYAKGPFAKAEPAEPTVIPNRCFVCGAPPIMPVIRIGGTRR